MTDFFPRINIVLRDVHPDLRIAIAAKKSVNNLLNDILSMVMSEATFKKKTTVTVNDIVTAVRRFLPRELLVHAFYDMFEANEKYNIDGLQEGATGEFRFSPSFVIRKVRTLAPGRKISAAVGVNIAALLEYLAAQILGAAGDLTLGENRVVISVVDVTNGIDKDQDLYDLLLRESD